MGDRPPQSVSGLGNGICGGYAVIINSAVIAVESKSISSVKIHISDTVV